MNTLLIFFAFPVATIILAIVLQKLINSPLLVAATFFAIFLIVTFAAFDESFLVFAILYALIALITALIVRFLCCLIRNSDNPCINGKAFNNSICGNNSDNDSDNSCGCSSRNNSSDNAINNCGCVDDNLSNNCGCNCNDRSYNNLYCNRRNFLRR